jgi:hypothetical protein
MKLIDRLANGLGTLLGVLVDTTSSVISRVKQGYEEYKREGGVTGSEAADEARRKKDRLRTVNDEIMHLRNEHMSRGHLSDAARNRWHALRTERESLLAELDDLKEIGAAERIIEAESVIDKVEINLETAHVLQYTRLRTRWERSATCAVDP